MFRPWHVRATAIAACLVALVAAVHYVLAQYRINDWLVDLGPRHLYYIKGLPDAADLGWGIAVWAGLLGALLLLGNRRFAAGMLAVAAIAAVVTTLWVTLFEATPIQVALGTPGLAVVVIWTALMLGFWLYARAMHRQGVTR